jgi:hypothetical protein
MNDNDVIQRAEEFALAWCMPSDRVVLAILLAFLPGAIAFWLSNKVEPQRQLPGAGHVVAHTA